LPDKSCGEEDQQRFGQWFIASDMVAEPGRNDPRENPHRDRGRRPHSKDLSERVLGDGRMSINRLGRRARDALGLGPTLRLDGERSSTLQRCRVAGGVGDVGGRGAEQSSGKFR
jgi:hypothetical protein